MQIKTDTATTPERSLETDLSELFDRRSRDQGVVWRNGSLIPFGDATVHVMSNMATRGTQISEVIPCLTVEGDPFAVALRPKVTRFLRSCELMGMVDIIDQSQLEAAVAQTVLANQSAVSQGVLRSPALAIRLMAGWTDDSLGLVPKVLRPSLWILPVPLPSSHDMAAIAPRVKACSVAGLLGADKDPEPLATGVLQADQVRCELAARADGWDTVLYRRGSAWLEPHSLVQPVLVSDGSLTTAPSPSTVSSFGAGLLLELAMHLGIGIERREVPWAEVMRADEIFLSTSLVPLQPLSRLDDREFPPPSDLLEELSAGLAEVYEGRHPLSMRWLVPLRSFTT